MDLKYLEENIVYGDKITREIRVKFQGELTGEILKLF